MYTVYIAQGGGCGAPSIIMHWCINLNDEVPQVDILETLILIPGFLVGQNVLVIKSNMLLMLTTWLGNMENILIR